MKSLITMCIFLFSLHSFTKVYVTSMYGSTVAVFNAEDNSFITEFTPAIDGITGSNMHGIVISPDQTKAYIVDQQNLGIWIINTSDNSTLAYVPFGGGSSPSQINVTPDGAKVYVSDESDSKVYVMRTLDNSISYFTGDFNKPSGIAFNPSGTKVYIAEDGFFFSGSRTTYVYNVSDNSFVTTITQESNSNFIAVNSQGIGYATNFFLGQMSVFDTLSDSALTPITLIGSNHWGIAFSDDGLTAYVACASDNTLQVVQNGEYSSSISLSNPPFVVAINPTNPNQIYCTQSSVNSVMVVENGVQVSAPAFDEHLTYAQYLAFIVVSSPAPTSLTGYTIQNRFIFETDIVNKLSWTAADAPNIVGYTISRDGQYLATTAGLSYEDHNRDKNTSYTYQVRSQNQNGELSEPVSITIP